MTREYIIMPEFERQWKAMGQSDTELKYLQEQLLLNPQQGPVMKGTGGLRKIRVAFEHQGKSGSGRVVYVDFPAYETIYLITAYPKNEKDNLSAAERNAIRKLIEQLEQFLNESILQGLNEAISTEKGHLRAKRCRMTVQPPEEFDAEEIRTIRLSANMTQKIFANFLGVSPKTVESWEAGRYKPDGPARRVMGLLRQDHMLAQKYGLISQ